LVGGVSEGATVQRHVCRHLHAVKHLKQRDESISSASAGGNEEWLVLQSDSNKQRGRQLLEPLEPTHTK
jgi:hypothetical protein